MKSLSFFQALPKVELHLHLDCSLSYNVVSRINPDIKLRQYENLFIAPARCNDLADFLRCAPSGIALMQSEENIDLVVQDLFDQLKQDNVIYVEIRYCPLLHLEEGLQPKQVVESVIHSVQKAVDQFGIEAGIIMSTLRNYTEEQSMSIVKLVEEYLPSTPVAGFDIAADEAGYPINAHKKAFQYAIENGIPRTAHAGEAKGPESIWETLEYFQTSRIGHGVRCIEDRDLVEYLADNQILLEVCPSCNVQISIFDTYADHPIDYLYKKGVPVSVNTDARTLVNITLSEEYMKLANTFGWTPADFKLCNSYALDYSFVDEGKKKELKMKLEKILI